MLVSLSMTIILVFNILNAHLVDSQCILGRPSKDKEFPDLSKIILLGYTATVQASYQSLRKSILATEYYDVKSSKGRVDLLENGTTKQFLYFNDTMETFTYSATDYRCEAKHVDEFVIPFRAELVQDWTYKGDDRIVLGPSAMLWNARDRYKNGKVNYIGEVKSESIREITAEVWRGCLNNEQFVVDYYFSVEEWHGEYGSFHVNIPLRIEIQGETGNKDNPFMDYIYEFGHFMPNILNKRKVFAIPTGYGCTRLAEDLPVAPSFVGSDIFYGAEIQYSETGDDHFYTTNVYYVEDAMSEHVGYYYSEWDKVGKKGVRSAKDYMFIVYNEPNGYLYNITKEKQSCVIKRVNEFDEGIPLPGGISLNLKNDVIIGDDSEKFYMGKSKRRGILCDVFEESKFLYGDETTPEFAFAVATRYYVSESEEYETASHTEEIPLQVLMRIKDSMSKSSAELVVNIFGFTTRLEEKNKLFNIENCFTKPSQRKLLHLTFEVANGDIIRSITGLIPMIKEEILELLIEFARLTPLRIPEILVDFDTVGIHAFANILERPDFLLDFEYLGHYTLEDAEDGSGLYTTTQCAKLCLERAGFCRAFSHCGAACYIALSESSANKKKARENCRFYKRLDTGSSVNRIETTDDAIRELSSAMLEKDFTDFSTKPSITVNWKNVKGESEFKQIPLTTFEVSSGDVNNMINSRIVDFDYHYNEYKYGAKLNREASHVKSHGRIPYQVCQKICLDDPECDSLSSCIPVPECLTSYKHGDELEDTDFVRNGKCVIVARKYVDVFVEYPGLIRVTQAAKEINATDQDKCAKECLNANDLPCRSFDFCLKLNDKNDRCLLHTFHFLDVKNKTSEIAVDETGLCGHYSRNYVRDFKKTKGKTTPAGGTSKYLKLTGVTVEQCAKECIHNGGFTCNSFDHCDGTEPYRSSCYLHSKKEEKNLINSPVCSNYIRQYYARGEDKLKISKKTKRFGAGAAAGLGIFFFLIGCGLGIVAVFAYGWYTGKRL